MTLVSLFDVNADVARKFGELDAYLLDRGRPSSQIDLLNAATAKLHDLTLVTHNLQDFAHLPGLRVLDWLKP